MREIKVVKQTPENVGIREEAAARCTTVIKGRVLMKQARKALEGEKYLVSRCRKKKWKGDRHFTDDGRGAEITVVLVLQARAKMSENKVNGPEGAVVSEMTKQLPWRRSALLRGVFTNASWV